MVQSVGKEVTDPALLAQLNSGNSDSSNSNVPTTGGTEVTDPNVLRQLNAPATKEPKPATPGTETSTGFTLLDKFKQGTANLLGLAGAPVSAVNFALTQLGWQDPNAEPVGGVQQVTRGWEGILGVKKLQMPKDLYGHESKTNEYMGSIAEFAGGMLLPGAGVVANSERKLLTATMQSLGTVASGTTAFEGGEIGKKLAPTFGMTEEQGKQIGTMAGGMASGKMLNSAVQGALKGTTMGKNALQDAGVTGVSKDAQQAAANGMLAKEVEASLNAHPDSIPNMARAIELSKKIDKFSPNIAQQTAAPGLVAMYREVANKSPEALAKAAAWEQKNLEAVAAHKEKVFGKSTDVNAMSLTDPAKIKIAADRDIVAMSLDTTERKMRELSTNFRRQIDNEAVGNELRDMYWKQRGVASAEVKGELAKVYSTARRVGITEDMTDVRDGVMKIIGSDRTTFQNMPPTFAKILQEYPVGTPSSTLRKAVQKPGQLTPSYTNVTVEGTAGKSTASFEEVHSLYKQANKDWADATIAGDSTKAHYMKAIRDQLQEKVAKYNDPKYGELAQKFTQFNKNYSKYAQVFKEGAGGEIAKRTRGGIATDSEDIVRKIVLGTGDKKRGVQDFFELYGSDARAAELLHDGLLDNYSKAAVKDGTFDPKAAQRWLDSHHSAMSELPETRGYLANAQKMGEALVNRRLELQQQRKAIDRSVLAKVATNETPEKLIQQAIADPKWMRAVLEGAYTTESKQAIARAITDAVTKKPDPFNFLKANEATLKPVLETLGKGHWQNLMDIGEAEAIAARTRAPTAVELAKIQDIGEQVIGTSVKGMFSRLRNLDKPMGVSKSYLLMDVGGRFFYKTRSEELGRLREAAMFDPEVGSTLARLVKKSSYSKAELLDLQKISFAAGVVSTAQAAAELQKKPKEVSPAERARRAAEGIGKWKRKPEGE